jgi:serine O-acetyltransferase
MINSKEDYLNYVCSDIKSLRVNRNLKSLFLNDVYRFQRVLRFLEFKVNCTSHKLIILVTKVYFHYLSKKLGFTIPINVFGPGLSIAHYGTIIVNGAARVGSNCRIHACTNIGTSAGFQAKAPKIGDNCYIGPGAKIFGDISIANNIAIGANSVVNKSFLTSDITIAGVPAKMISDKSSLKLI